MKIFFIIFVVIAGFIPAQGFYSNTGVEADVSYEAEYLMEGAKPSTSDAYSDLRTLVYYMAGPLQKSSPIAGPKFDHRLQVQSITQVETGWLVRYRFQGTFVIQKKNFDQFKIYLPKSARKIYRQAYNPDGWGNFGKHPCTEGGLVEYLTEKYFWYFWNPNKSGCRLKEGEHYDVIVPRVQTKNNLTRQSYPEYDRMVNPQGNLDFMIFFGADQDQNGFKAPEGNRDVNAPNYRQVSRSLLSQGFSVRRWASSDYQNFCRTNSSLQQTVDEFVRMDGSRKVTVRLLWGTTSLRPESLPFYCLLDHAVSDSSLVIYNGHSGLGASLFLHQLKKEYPYPFVVNKNQYQVMAFNGCSSYGYYNQDFFNEKITPANPTGTKNLEVLTNGIAGNFADLGDMTLSLLQASLDWSARGERTTYQELIDRMKTDYLTSVNGDEDNP